MTRLKTEDTDRQQRQTTEGRPDRKQRQITEGRRPDRRPMTSFIVLYHNYFQDLSGEIIYL